MRHLVCFLAALALLIPPPAIAQTRGGASGCGSSSYNEMRAARQAMVLAASAGNVSMSSLSRSAAFRNAARCEIQKRLTQDLRNSARGCDALVESYHSMVRYDRDLTAGVGGLRVRLSRDYFNGALRQLHVPLDQCWRSLARECFNMGNPAIASQLASILQVAQGTGYPISRFNPPMRACNSTVPQCEELLAAAQCDQYMLDVAAVMFMSRGVFNVVSNMGAAGR